MKRSRSSHFGRSGSSCNTEWYSSATISMQDKAEARCAALAAFDMKTTRARNCAASWVESGGLKSVIAVRLSLQVQMLHPTNGVAPIVVVQCAGTVSVDDVVDRIVDGMTLHETGCQQLVGILAI